MYRDENTGQLQGLSRVRSITQDDAHVFCRLDQVKDEARAIANIITKFYEAFGMPLKAQSEYEEELENLNIDAAVAQAKANRSLDVAQAGAMKAGLAA